MFASVSVERVPAMRSFNLSTRQIIALFSSAAFLAIVVNSFILFGADAPRRVLHVVLPGQAKPEPEVSTPPSLSGSPTMSNVWK